jgi:hypothetical protein
MLNPADIAAEVKRVLEGAEISEGHRGFLNAYQILDRLSFRDELVSECSRVFKGSGAVDAAAALVSDCAKNHLETEIQIESVATRGIRIEVAGMQVLPRKAGSLLFRLPRGRPPSDRF